MSKPKSAKIDITQYRKRLESIVNKAVSVEQMRMIAQFARNQLVKQAVLGKFVQGTSRGSAPQFSNWYQAFRIGNSKNMSSGDPRTTPKKNHAVFTGQLMRSIQVTRVSKGVAIIAPTGTRTAYKVNSVWPYRKPKKARKKPKRIMGQYVVGKEYEVKPKLTNAQVATYLIAKGRRIMGLSESDYSLLVKYYRRSFGDLVRKQMRA